MSQDKRGLGLFASLRDWWRWKTQNNQLNIFGMAEFKTPGLVIDRKSVVGALGEQWVIEDSNGRVVFVRCDDSPDLHLGDRVEMAPISQGIAIRPYLWRVVRKITP